MFSKQPQSSLEQHTLQIRHRELDGYLPLTALGGTTGGTTIQQTSSDGNVLPTNPNTCPFTDGKPMEAFLRSCLGPTENTSPNAKILMTRWIVVRTIFATHREAVRCSCCLQDDRQDKTCRVMN